MKKLYKWIFPILTCLVVLALSALPQYLSKLQDKKLSGRVHTEELLVENNLPVSPPDLAQRAELLARWLETPEVPTAELALSDYAAYDRILQSATNELTVFFPSDFVPTEITNHDISRMYLQHQLVGAEVFVLGAYIEENNVYIRMMIDAETERIMTLELNHPQMEKYYDHLTPADIGERFLGRLGLENDVYAAGQFEALFSITGVNLDYGVILDSYTLRIVPMMTYTATDAATDAHVSVAK